MAVTPAQFKDIKAQFAAVPDATVQLYLDMAADAADSSWGEARYQMGVIMMACHLMTLDGLGTDPASRSFAKGMGDIQTVKSADLTLSRFQRAAGLTPYQEWLGSTPCGQQYLTALRLAKRGPRVVMAAAGHPVSGYAKDVNSYGWPGVFGV